MATDDPIRASDADREVVVGTLREAFTVGRLTMDEFDTRMTAAYASKTWGDLRELTVDLPVQPVLGADIPGRQLPAPVPAVSLPVARTDEETDTEPVDEQEAPAVPPRRRPAAILIPVAIWALLVVHSGTAHSVVILVIAAFVLSSIMAAIRRH